MDFALLTHTQGLTCWGHSKGTSILPLFTARTACMGKLFSIERACEASSSVSAEEVTGGAVRLETV